MSAVLPEDPAVPVGKSRRKRNFLDGYIDFKKLSCYNFLRQETSEGALPYGRALSLFQGKVAAGAGMLSRDIFLIMGNCKEENENVLC